MKLFALAATVAAVALFPSALPADTKYVPDQPAGAVKYRGANYTQSIFVLNDRDTILMVPITDLPDTRWHQPGGMEGITGYRTEKYKYVPEDRAVRKWVGNIFVKNSFGHFQPNRGLQRAYPDGTRFDEVFYNSKSGEVFEHRVREKVSGKWKSEVRFRDETEYPTGYTGLKVTCSSCHAEAGTGGYAVGLVPGGDTILSDPLPWELWTGAAEPPEGAKKPTDPAPKVVPKPTPKADPKPTETVPSAPPARQTERRRLFPNIRRR